MNPALPSAAGARGGRLTDAKRPRADRRAPAAPATLALLSLGVFLAGCPRHLPVARPYPAPTAATLRELVTAQQRAVVSMNARARATSWIGGERVRATVLMLVERAGRLRFEAEVSLQGTVAVLATDGHRFAFLDTQKNQLQQGAACPNNVASLIRIPLAPEDVAAILLGDVRLPAPARAPDDGTAASPTATVSGADDRVDWDADQGADVLSVRHGDGRLRVLFQRAGDNNAGVSDRETRVIGATALGPDGRPLWRAAFEDFTPVATGGGGAPRVALPRIIRFAEGDDPFDGGVEVKIKERTLDEPLAPEAFTVTTPAGATIFEMPCPPARSPARD